MKTIIVDLIALCTGIVLCHLAAGEPLSESYVKMYWCVFGGGYIAVKNKLWKYL